MQDGLAGLVGGAVGTAYGYGGMGAGGGGAGKLGTRGRGSWSYRGAAPAPRSVTLGAPVVIGSLDKEVIRRVIQQHQAEVRLCYERELLKTPGMGSKVSVRMEIGPDGSVRSAVIDRSTLGSPAVEACVAARARSWRFPAPSGGGNVVVTYPFSFLTAP